MKELFEVIPGGNPFRRLPGQCRRCAVVGGAGNLIGSGYGSLIDSKEVVIRSVYVCLSVQFVCSVCVVTG